MGLDIVEIVMDAEDAFGIDIPYEIAQRVETAGDLHAVVIETIRATSPSMEGRLCRKCGYSLRGLQDPRCPECGAPFVQYDNVDPNVVWGILVEIISYQLAVKPEQVKPESRFIGDLSKE